MDTGMIVVLNADMTVSVRRHNLARMRWNLSLTQADVARMVGCSLQTIKSIETGKLALSEGLASRISQELGFFDKDWLLENDLNTPLPPISNPLSLPSVEEETQSVILDDLFSRLFAVVAKMNKKRSRLVLELHLAERLDTLRKSKEANPDAKPDTIVGSNSVKFFIENPEQFDPDLREWVNLEGLLKANQRLIAGGGYETEAGPKTPEEVFEWRDGKKAPEPPK